MISYKFPIEEEEIPCLCGAPNCRGTLNQNYINTVVYITQPAPIMKNVQRTTAITDEYQLISPKPVVKLVAGAYIGLVLTASGQIEKITLDFFDLH